MRKNYENPSPASEHLLHLINAKDPSGFNMLYDRYWHPLVDYAYTLLPYREDAKETVQNLIIAIWQKGLYLKNESSLLAYLKRALKNRAINFLRDNRNYRRHLQQKPVEDCLHVQSVTGQVYLNELVEKMEGGMKGLPERYREVFQLTYSMDMTVPEISRALSRPVATVEKQLRKARTQVRGYLSAHYL